MENVLNIFSKGEDDLSFISVISVKNQIECFHLLYDEKIIHELLLSSLIVPSGLG